MTAFTSWKVLCTRSDCLCDVVSQHLVNLFARLANDNIGFVDWTPYIPTVSHEQDYVDVHCVSVKVIVWFV